MIRKQHKVNNMNKKSMDKKLEKIVLATKILILVGIFLVTQLLNIKINRVIDKINLQSEAVERALAMTEFQFSKSSYRCHSLPTEDSIKAIEKKTLHYPDKGWILDELPSGWSAPLKK